MAGFIDFIVAPSMDVCGELLDQVYAYVMGEEVKRAELEATRAASEAKSRPKSATTLKLTSRVMSVDSGSDAAR